MEAKQETIVSYNIDIAQQVDDGLMTAEDMVEWLGGKMKVRNSRNVAQKEIKLESRGSSVVLSTKKENIIKKNLKQYIKRYLRSKSLSNFVKPHGNEEGFKLDYINKVDETE